MKMTVSAKSSTGSALDTFHKKLKASAGITQGDLQQLNALVSQNRGIALTQIGKFQPILMRLLNPGAEFLKDRVTLELLAETYVLMFFEPSRMKKEDAIIEFQNELIFRLCGTLADVLTHMGITVTGSLRNMAESLQKDRPHFAALEAIKGNKDKHLALARLNFFTMVLRNVLYNGTLQAIPFRLPLIVEMYLNVLSVELLVHKLNKQFVEFFSRFLHCFDSLMKAFDSDMLPKLPQIFTVLAYQLEWTAGWSEEPGLLIQPRLALHRLLNTALGLSRGFSLGKYVELLPRYLAQINLDLSRTAIGDNLSLLLVNLLHLKNLFKQKSMIIKSLSMFFDKESKQKMQNVKQELNRACLHVFSIIHKEQESASATSLGSCFMHPMSLVLLVEIVISSGLIKASCAGQMKNFLLNLLNHFDVTVRETATQAMQCLDIDNELESDMPSVDFNFTSTAAVSSMIDNSDVTKPLPSVSQPKKTKGTQTVSVINGSKTCCTQTEMVEVISAISHTKRQTSTEKQKIKHSSKRLYGEQLDSDETSPITPSPCTTGKKRKTAGESLVLPKVKSTNATAGKEESSDFDVEEVLNTFNPEFL